MCKADDNPLLKEVTRVMNNEIEQKKMEGDKKHAVNEVEILNGRKRFPEERRIMVYDK